MTNRVVRARGGYLLDLGVRAPWWWHSSAETCCSDNTLYCCVFRKCI